MAQGDKEDKETAISLARQQIAVANAKEMLSKITENCFKKCIYKPGSSLDGSEQRCINQCMDRFLDSWNLVSRTYGNRLEREQIDAMRNKEKVQD